MDDYTVTEVDVAGRPVGSPAYTGRDHRAAGKAEDALLAAGKNTRVSKGREVLAERSPQRKAGPRP